jgi:amidase
MAGGQVSSEQLVQRYLARIAALDRSGPKLQSMIELNPEALAHARVLDAERRAGSLRGVLHGLPVVLKDNIATGDQMATSAGSLALAGTHAMRDAHLVQRLRAQGAVILGKTNLSEWANIRSTRSISGWSGRGGLTRNPYALDRTTSGSSSGSAAAAAANLTALAIGSETDGSIVSPSSINGLVGLKPTVGRVSRDGIIPISHTQDTAGPIVRSVADAALLLSAIAGSDGNDPATQGAPAPDDYLAALDPHALRGARLGVAREYFTGNDEVDHLIDQEIAKLKSLGAEIIDPIDLAKVEYSDAELDVLLYEFKHDLPVWLATFAPHASIKNLSDVIAFDQAQASREMPFFRQELFDKANALGGLDSAAYLSALASCAKQARDDGLKRVLESHRLDAIIAPTGGPAWLTDVVNGDSAGAGFSTPAAVAGFPHLTVPAGFVRGLPIGLSFVGAAWSEARLLGLGYAYEQATRHRRAPQFLTQTAIPAGV